MANKRSNNYFDEPITLVSLYGNFPFDLIVFGFLLYRLPKKHGTLSAFTSDMIKR